MTCQCGCGQPTPAAKVSNSRYSQVAGEPRPFLPNHKRRVVPTLRPRIDNPQPGAASRIWVTTEKGRAFLSERKVALTPTTVERAS